MDAYTEPIMIEPMKITISPAPLPDDTWLQTELPAGYSDTFIAEWESERCFASEEMLIAVFCWIPPWLGALYTLRNFLVSLFGIAAATETGNDEGKEKHSGEKLANVIRAGGTCRMFLLPFKSYSETVLLGKDRHLDFYLSLQAAAMDDKRRTMTATTLVRYNNLAGKLYFFVVRPFHRLIVPAMMKGAIRALEEGKDGNSS